MKKLTTLVTAVALAGVMGCAVEYSEGRRYGYANHYRDDAAISAAVQSELDAQGLRRVSATTSGGTVYLGGVVRDADARQYAGRIASHTRGVDRVVNNIEIGGHYRAGDAPEGWEPKGQGERHFHPWVDGDH